MALEQYANAPIPSSPTTPWTTLSFGVDAVTMTILVVSFAPFPSAVQFRILIDDELMLVTGGAGTTSWTVTRGIEGTTAAVHAIGAAVFQPYTKGSALNNPLAMTTAGAMPYLNASLNQASLAAPADGNYVMSWADAVPSWASPAMAGLLTAATAADTYVVGPASAVDNAIARYDGTTGRVIQDYTSGAPTISDTGEVYVSGGFVGGLFDVTGVLNVSTPGGGATAYKYHIIALDAHGNTTASTYVYVEDGPAVLDATNYNEISWNAVAGAVGGYDVYADQRDGTPFSLGKLGHVAQGILTFRDDGVVADDLIVEPDNTTGMAAIYSLTVQNFAWPTRYFEDLFTPTEGPNVFFGLYVGPVANSLPVPTGGLNVAFGYNSLLAVTSGVGNVSLGSGNLTALTTGTYNLGIGVGSGNGITTGNGNLSVGSNTDGGGEGDFNTMVGHFAGGAIDGNVAWTTGSKNTFIGGKAGTTLDTVTNAIVLGAGAVVSESNRAVIGSATVTDVYFGSETGAATLHAAGQTLTGSQAFASADLGPTLVTNGTFTGAATGWTLGAGWAYGANAVTHTPGSTATLAQDPLGGGALIVGRTYVVDVGQTAGTVGAATITAGGVVLDQMLEGVEGVYTRGGWIVATSTAGIIITPDTDYDGTLDNVSVQLVPEPLATSWNLPYAETETQNWRWTALVDGGSGSLAAQFGDDAGTVWADRLRLFSGVGGALAIAADNVSFTAPEDVGASFVFSTSGTGDASVDLETEGGELSILLESSGAASFSGATVYSMDAALWLLPVAIADLHATPTAGMLQSVNDALVPVLGDTVADGGAAYALVTFNGSAWTVCGI